MSSGVMVNLKKGFRYPFLQAISKGKSCQEDEETDRTTGIEESTSNDNIDCTPFERTLWRIQQNPTQTEIHLKNFTANFQVSDVYTLQSILSKDDREWKWVKFTDTVPAHQYRRWVHKTKYISRRLEKLATAKDISLRFETTLEVSFSLMPVSAIVSVLQEVQKTPSTRVIKFSGKLHYSDIDNVVAALKALLMYDHRPWRAIVFYASFSDKDRVDYNRWRTAMRKANESLEKLSYKLNITIKVQQL